MPIKSRRKSIAVDNCEHYRPEKPSKFQETAPSIDIFAKKPSVANLPKIPKIPNIPGPSNITAATPEAIANILKTCKPQETVFPKVLTKKAQMIEPRLNTKKSSDVTTVTVTKTVTKTVTTTTKTADRKRKLQELAVKQKERRLSIDSNALNDQRRISKETNCSRKIEASVPKVKFTQNNRSDRMMDDLPTRFAANRKRRNSVATATEIHAEVATGDNQNILVSPPKPLFEIPIPKVIPKPKSLKSCLKLAGASSKTPKKSVQFGGTETRYISPRSPSPPPQSRQQNDLEQYSTKILWDQKITEILMWNVDDLESDLKDFSRIAGCEVLPDVKLKYDDIEEYKRFVFIKNLILN